MTTHGKESTDQKCPYCGKPLVHEEYQRARKKLEKDIEKGYIEQTSLHKKKHENEVQQLNKAHKDYLESQEKQLKDKAHKDYLESQENFKTQFTTMQTTLQAGHMQRIDEIRKEHSEETKTKEKKKQDEENDMKSKQRKELLDKDNTIKKLQGGMDREIKTAKEEAIIQAGQQSAKKLQESRGQTAEKVIELERMRKEIRELKDKENSQAELKGEAGELELLARLKDSFQSDVFTRPKRGESSADIIQKIAASPGRFLNTVIAYDNKAASSVTKTDIDKAKRYRDQNDTNCVIIVSSNLPRREVKNALIGGREGILLIHPSIVVEVAEQLRRFIIEIAKQSGSKKDRDAKESRLYDYIKSSDYARKVEGLLETYKKMTELQRNEEKTHHRLWKYRKELQSDINQAYMEITTGVDSILQEKAAMEELDRADFENKVIAVPYVKRKSLQKTATKNATRVTWS